MSKLSNKFPVADPKQLTFLNPGQECIALVFAQRLAAFAKAKGKKLYISSGYRGVEYQKKLYEQNCRQYPPNGNGYVARPGSSWHNGRCAVDIDDRGFWKNYMESGDMKKSVKKQELYKYGLCLPLNRVDARTVFEWWHIQPIETLSYTGDKTKFLASDDRIYFGEGETVAIKEFQHITGLVPDGIAGPKTKEKAKEVRKVIDQILGAQAIESDAKIIINGKPLSSELLNKGGSLYAPVRAVAEAFGKVVTWNGANNTADIK